MRTGAAAVVLISGLLALNSCGGSTAPTTTTIQGNVFASPSAGGAVVQGARVTASAGDASKSVITGIDGSFSLALNTAQTAQTFTLTVEPPAGSSLYASTYDRVPLADYRSEYGAANLLSLYLGTTNPSAALPGAAPRRGCVGGTLLNTNGQALASNALAVVPVAGGQPVARPLYPNCATAFADVPNFTASLALAPRPGETGLITYGGARFVRTDAQGKYLLPVQTTQNLHAVSGFMWAGDYDATDTGDLSTANAVYWSKFQYVPEVPVFTSGATDTRNLRVESFDPATNARVTTLPISYDVGAVERTAGSNFDVSTTPTVEPAITSGTVTLGEYYKTNYQANAAGETLRVLKLAGDAESQNVSVASTLVRYNPADNTLRGSSTFTGWRNGTNLGQALTANFLGIPAPQAPAAEATGTPRTPTLGWNAVPGAKVYNVGLYRVRAADDIVPVWVGNTTNTSVTVPLTLEAGAQYLWQVYTDDSSEMIDYIGKDPLAVEGARWQVGGTLPKARRFDSALNAWRGEAALGIARATGRLPQRVAPDRAYQRLQETGYREASSQEFTFTTGN